MLIKELQIKNFKGLKELNITFGGKTKIYGENATGKSSIADAINWLLFGKNAEDKKEFEIKTVGKNADVEVIGIFDSCSLKRVYKEKYTRKTGETSKELTGHTTNYFINDKPTKEKDYQEYIKEICKEDIFKMLTNPLFFASLDWKKQREIMCSIIDSQEIETKLFDDNEKFELIKPFIADYDLSRKNLTAQKRKVNELLKEIPVRIDEIQKNIGEIDEEFVKEQNKKINELKEKIEAIKNENSKVEEIATENKTKLYNEISFLNEQLALENEKAYKIQEKEKEGIYGVIKAKKEDIERFKNKIQMNSKDKIDYDEIKKINDEITKDLETLSEMRTNYKNELVELREKWEQKNKEKFEISTNDTKCKACQQELPDNFKELKIKKLQEEFEKTISIEKKEITEKGKLVKSKLKAVEDNEKNKVNAYELNLGKLHELRTEIEKINTEECRKKIYEIQEDIKELETKLSEVKEIKYDNTKVEELKRKIAEINIEKIDYSGLENILIQEKGKLETYQNNQRQRDRIQELKKEIKTNSDLEVDIEEKLILLQEFYLQKMKQLEMKLTELFNDGIGFKVYHQQINGAIAETFEITVNNVPWNSVNTSGKIKSGLKIINVLSQKFNFYPFIIIDNSECITDIPNITNQLITLEVSKQDKILRIEKVD